MEKPLPKELILIAIVAVIAIVGVVGITKISSVPKELLLQESLPQEEIVGQAFNTCAYYQNRYEYYNGLDGDKYKELADTYNQLLELYCQ